MFCIHLSYTTGLFRFEETFNFSDFQSANWNEDEFYRFGWTKWIQSRRSFRFEIFQAFPVLDSFVRPKLKFRSGVTCLRDFSFQWKVFPSKVVFWRPREKVSRAAFQWIKRNSLIKSQITPYLNWWFLLSPGPEQKYSAQIWAFKFGLKVLTLSRIFEVCPVRSTRH